MKETYLHLFGVETSRMWEFDLLIEAIRFNPLSRAINSFVGVSVYRFRMVLMFLIFGLKPKNTFFPLSFRAFGSLMTCVVKNKTEQERTRSTSLSYASLWHTDKKYFTLQALLSNNGPQIPQNPNTNPIPMLR